MPSNFVFASTNHTGQVLMGKSHPIMCCFCCCCCCLCCCCLCYCCLCCCCLCCCCCCCCSRISWRNQVRGHRTGSSHSGSDEYPRGKHKQTKGLTRSISQTQLMPPPEMKSEIGIQPMMCQVHTGAYVSLLAPGKSTIMVAS